jgi:hypothetical protein
MTPRLLAHLRFALARHGWPAALGLVLLAMVWPLAHWGADAARAEADTLLARASALRRQPPAPGPTPADAEQQRARWEAALPGEAGATAAVEFMHRSAIEHGVVLAAGEYRLVREGQSPLRRYQISLPASGRYSDLRDWMAAVVNEWPSLATDELQLVRDGAGNAQVQARVRWTLYLKDL